MVDSTKLDVTASGASRNSVLANRTRHDSYVFQCDVQTRFADLDRLNHINNVAIGFLFEEARLRFHERLDGPIRRSVEFPLVMVQANYSFIAETFYPASVRVGLAVGAIGRTSFTYLMALFQNDRCTSLCDATLVLLHGRIPSQIPDDLRAALLAFRPADESSD